MSPPPRFRLDSPATTHRTAATLAQLLHGGEVLALCGPLGAGKTHFVKGLAAGLGVPPAEPVVSPTFVLVREYQGRLRLYHLDAYRLADAAELEALGFAELCADPAGVVVVEWADRVRLSMPPAAWWLDLAYLEEQSRLLQLRMPDPELASAAAGALAEAGVDKLSEADNTTAELE